MSRTDEGVATVWALALVQVLLLVGLLTWVVASVAITRQRVATVADVAALAAAQATGDACAQAELSAVSNGMRLASCVLDGPDVLVEVVADAPAIAARGLTLLGRDAPPITATARAGSP